MVLNKKGDISMGNITKISVWGLAALFLVNFAFMADFVIIPAVDAIYTEFADVPIGVVNFIVTGSQLTAIISPLLAGIFTHYFSKKTVIVFFFALFTVSAILTGAVQNAYYIAVMRAIAGFAFGALPPVAIALINEVYRHDEKKSNWLVGTFNAFMALIGAAMAYVAGILCAIQWNWVFFEYFAAIPMLIFMIIFIPKTPPEKDSVVKTEEGKPKERVHWPPVIALLFSLVLFGIIYFFMMYQLSVYVKEVGLGGAGFAGTLSSIMVIGSTLGGFVFAILYSRLKRVTISILFLILTLGYVGSSFVLGPVWFALCCGLLGFAYGTALPYYYQYITVLVPESKMSACLGFVTASIGIGAFVSSYIVTFLIDVLELPGQLALCPYYAGAAGVAFIVSVVLSIINRRRVA